MAELNLKAVITAEDKASGVVQNFGNDLRGNLNKAAAAITGVGVALTLVAKQATDFTKDFVSGAKQIARETGESIENSSKLLVVTNRLGLGVEEASQMFGFLSKRIVDANNKTAEAAAGQAELENKINKTKIRIAELTKKIQEDGDASGKLSAQIDGLNIDLREYEAQLSETINPLQRLGIATKTVTGVVRPFNEILLELADKFKAMPNGAEKTALAMEIFGRSGKDMLKVLNLGSQGIKDLQDNADKLGLTLTADTVQKVSKFVESQRSLKEATGALKLEIGTLTAPVLTAFNNKLVELAVAFQNADGPLKTMTAHVLAFGGPVLAATGGATAFAANVAEIGPAAAGASQGLLIVGGAIVSLAQAIGLLTIGMFVFNETFRNNVLTVLAVDTAHRNLTIAIDGAKASIHGLQDAFLAAEGSALAVERAQRNYNDAVTRYGPESLEAREAAHNLEVAQNNLRDANERAKKAQDDHIAAVKAVPQAVNEANQALSDSNGYLAEHGGFWGGLISKVNGFADALKKITPADLGKFLVPGLRGLQHGGPINAGQPYLVGEAGPEIVVPRSSGQVIPNHKISPTSGGGGTINLNVNIGMFAGSPMERRKIATSLMKDFQDAAKQLGVNPTSLLDNANGVMLR